MKVTRMLVLFAAVSLIALPARPETIHFALGFTGVQTAQVSGGTLRFVDVHIGSNEDAGAAAAWNLWVTLTVKRGTTTVCQSSVEMISKVRPAIRPLQFRVLYPTLKTRTDPRLQLAKVDYHLYSKLEVREPGTSKLIATAANDIVWEFAGGGTPSCVKN